MALSTAAEGFLATANAVAPAGILTALGILLLSLCMLKGIYHRRVAILEIVTGGLGILLEAIRPMAGLVYGLYGLLLPVWFIAVGIRLFRVGFRVRAMPDQAPRPDARDRHVPCTVMAVGARDAER